MVELSIYHDVKERVRRAQLEGKLPNYLRVYPSNVPVNVYTTETQKNLDSQYLTGVPQGVAFIKTHFDQTIKVLQEQLTHPYNTI